MQIEDARQFGDRAALRGEQDQLGALADAANGMPGHVLQFGHFVVFRIPNIDHGAPPTPPL